MPATATVTDSLPLAEADEADTEEDAVADEAEVDDADADPVDADAEAEVEDAEDEEEELVASALRRLCCGSSSVSSVSYRAPYRFKRYRTRRPQLTPMFGLCKQEGYSVYPMPISPSI